MRAVKTLSDSLYSQKRAVFSNWQGQQFRSQWEYENYQDLQDGQQILSDSHDYNKVKKMKKNNLDNPMRKPT
jgi:hypothetical protein